LFIAVERNGRIEMMDVMVVLEQEDPSKIRAIIRGEKSCDHTCACIDVGLPVIDNDVVVVSRKGG